MHCAIVPASAASDTVPADKSALWVAVIAVLIRAIPIPAPFPYIAVHIVKAMGVWREISYGGSFFPINAFVAAVVRVIPIEISERSGDVVSSVKGRG
jgi:hypothetical protein